MASNCSVFLAACRGHGRLYHRIGRRRANGYVATGHAHGNSDAGDCHGHGRINTCTDGNRGTAATHRNAGPCVADAGSRRGRNVRRLRVGRRLGGPVIPQTPSDVAFIDDGELVAADFGRSEVHILDDSGEVVTSTAIPDASGDPGVLQVTSVATGADGRIYAVSSTFGRIHLLDQNGNILAQKSLERDNRDRGEPNFYDVVVGPDGRVYAVSGKNRSSGTRPEPLYGVYVFDTELNLLDTWEAPRSRIPLSAAIDENGVMYIATYNAGQDTFEGPPLEEPDRVVTFDLDQYNEEVWTDDPLIEKRGQVDGLAFGPDGNLLVVEEASGDGDDISTTRISRFSPGGELLDEWEVPEQRHVGIGYSSGIASAPDGLIHLADGWNNRILQLDGQGDVVGEVSGVEPGLFGDPAGLTTGPGGNIYVTDTVLHRVQIFDPEGSLIAVWDFENRHQGYTSPRRQDVAIGLGGNAYVGDPALRGRVVKLSADGEEIDVWERDPERRSGSRPRIFDPFSVAVGAGGHVYLVMEMHPFIETYSSEGEFVEQWPEDSGEHGYSRGVATDGDTVYGLVTGGSRDQPLLVIRPLGDPEAENIVEFALRPDQEISGAISGAVPYDLTVDPEGNFLVPDEWGRRVFKFGPDGEELARWNIETGSSESRARLYVAGDDDCRVYVSDSETRQILVYEPVE